MKYPQDSSQIMSHISKLKLSPTQYRTLLNWISDKKSFNPTDGVLADRIGINREQVNKALSSLEKMDVLVMVKWNQIENGKYVKVYDLHPDFLKAARSSLYSHSNPSEDEPCEEFNSFNSSEFKDAEQEYYEQEKWLEDQVYSRQMITEEDYKAFESDLSKYDHPFINDKDVENNPQGDS